MTGKNLPAIAGGTPVKTTAFSRDAKYGKEELRELEEALEQGSLFYAHGKKVTQLEDEFAALHGSRFAIATSSGTASIHAALIAAGISPGDEVITSPITDMGSVIPILYQGAVPVFADVGPHSHVMTPESVTAVVTPQTKAVLAVHLWGNACDLDGLNALCKERGIMLIEDCAQAYWCIYKGRLAGTHGAIGCFSLNEFKHISCGDGGVVVTDDEELAVRLRLATDKGYDRRPGVTDRNPTFLAANYRMTELQGAVARAQLRKVQGIVERRQAWCGGLSRRLGDIEGLILPQVTQGCEPSWWFYMLRVVPEVLGLNADEFADALKAEGMPVAAHYIGRCVYEYDLFTKHSAFARGAHAYERIKYAHGICPQAEELLDHAVVFSINEGYSESDLAETVEAFHKVAAWAARRKVPA